MPVCQVLLLLYSLAIPLLAAEEMTSEELEQWFNDDPDDESRALSVNEGNLVFLEQIPNNAALHSANTLHISKSSLRTGWVTLSQCHAQLDAVATAQIVYRYQRLRNLAIDSTHGIQRAWVEGNSVQLSEVQKDAKLCISGEVGILHKTPAGFVLRNGPFHRQFLDGYYPMHVTLDIQYPESHLAIREIKPSPQPGFSITKSSNRVLIDTWFEGKLNTEVRFSIKPKPIEIIKNANKNELSKNNNTSKPGSIDKK